MINKVLQISTILSTLWGISSYESIAQNTFPSPGSQLICSTTSPDLSEVVATDGVSITASLRLLSSCLDTNLATFSMNTPASFRKPTFCYNNGYMPASYANPLAISRNSTANGGSCAGGVSSILADFSQGVIKPSGLSFVLCDLDNTYDSVIVNIYSDGQSIDFNFEFLEPDPALSFVYSNNTTGRGADVAFNGGANGVWGESSSTTDFEKGAVRIYVDSGIVVDSVVVNHVIKNNRNDINAAISFGNFIWEAIDPLSIEISQFEAFSYNSQIKLEWTSELKNSDFTIERSKDGKLFEPILGSVFAESDYIYSFVDVNPHWGMNYYRIKVILENGKSVYSTTKFVENSVVHSDVEQVFPNPMNDYLYIKNNDNRLVKIFDITGKKVFESHISEKIEVANWPSGIYILQFQDGPTQKLIKN